VELETALDRLHRAAYPVAAQRPPRLHTGELQGVLEDWRPFSNDFSLDLNHGQRGRGGSMYRRFSIVTAVAIGIATLPSMAYAENTSPAGTTDEPMESCNPLLDDDYDLPSATLIVDDTDIPTGSLPGSPKPAAR
jgi:hypothetical protein